MSFVWGAGQCRASCASASRRCRRNHCYYGMEYSEDRAKIAEWAPLIMDGRGRRGAVRGNPHHHRHGCRLRRADPLAGKTSFRPARRFSVHYKRRGRWTGPRGRRALGGCRYRGRRHGGAPRVSSKFVFIGAGGGALQLLQKSSIPEGQGLWRLPGQRHLAALRRRRRKPPPSCQGLRQGRRRDRRRCRCRTSTHASSTARHSLLFGPYAGFSTRFLKHGSLTDLFTSLTFDNIVPLLACGARQHPR